MNRHFFTVTGPLVILLFSQTAGAQSLVVRLNYTVENGANGCPNAENFQDQVSAAIGYIPFRQDSAMVMDVWIEVVESRLRGTLTILEWGAMQGSQEYWAGLSECHDLVSAMALAAAMRIDPVLAQANPGSQPESPPVIDATPPDIVRLRDGSLIRGTISERMEGLYVIIVTVTGQARRFEMSNVEYAGPAEGFVRPQVTQQPPPSPPERPSFRVRFRSVPTGLSIHVLTLITRGRRSAERYLPLCTTPCQAGVEPGRRRFALSPYAGRRVLIDDAVMIQENDSFLVRFEDNRRYRSMGWSLVGVGAGLGVASFIASFVAGFDVSTNYETYDRERTFEPAIFWSIFATGLVTTIIFEVIGVRLTKRRDVTDVVRRR